jgi:hypothetical protein
MLILHFHFYSFFVSKIFYPWGKIGLLIVGYPATPSNFVRNETKLLVIIVIVFVIQTLWSLGESGHLDIMNILVILTFWSF